MKFTFATLSLVSLVAAQNGFDDIMDQMPDCMWMQCLMTGIQNTDCAVDDFECVCSNFDGVSQATVPCLENESDCNRQQIDEAVLATQQFCNDLDSEDASVSLPVVITTDTDSETATGTATEAQETVTETEVETETGTEASETGSQTETETETATTGSATETPTGDEDGDEDDDSAGSRAQAAGFGLAAALAAVVAL